MRSFIEWWNTPTENLKTNGENIVSLVFLVLPLGLLLTFPLLNLLQLVEWTWWYVGAPVLMLLTFPLVTIFMVTGRSVLLKGFSVKELPQDDLAVMRYVAATKKAISQHSVPDDSSVRVYEDLEDSTTVYVVYRFSDSTGAEKQFRLELDKKKLLVRRAEMVQKSTP